MSTQYPASTESGSEVPNFGNPQRGSVTNKSSQPLSQQNEEDQYQRSNMMPLSQSPSLNSRYPHRNSFRNINIGLGRDNGNSRESGLNEVKVASRNSDVMRGPSPILGAECSDIKSGEAI